MKPDAPYDGMGRWDANYLPLTPLGFLDRAAQVHPRRPAVVYGSLTRTWAQMRDRCYRMASALVSLGIKRNETVSILCPNTPEMLEAHFGVPLAGAVLNTINCRLDAQGIAFILRHAESRVLFVDQELSSVAAAAIATLEHRPIIIGIHDCLAPSGALTGEVTYEAFLATGDPDFSGLWPENEWQPIALNYTSGTTGDPKGVVTSHRATYLMSMLQMTNWPLARAPRYLWTLPMFHANGWCFTWAITAAAGTHICMRKVNGQAVIDAIEQHGVDHFCAAPIVLAMIAESAGATRFPHPVRVLTAGSPPPASVLRAVMAQGFDVDHVYGITEASGTPVSCVWQDGWDSLPDSEQRQRRVRQGLELLLFEGLLVADHESLSPVPHDGVTAGELLLRGNTVMMGYFKNPRATEQAFSGGWFHTGDVAVVHEGGYVQIIDRSKDVIISGGENISSIEIEEIIHGHPAVLHAAVVAKPDDKWGEVPCAFVELKVQVVAPSAAELIAFCQVRLARFKCPREVIFGALPKTATGKIQNFAEEQAGSRAAITRLASDM